MADIVRRLPWSPDTQSDLDPLLTREWLVTNGLGGYASGTISGVVTRRYHGVLVAALPSPLGRTMMLGELDPMIKLTDKRKIDLSGEERAGTPPQVGSARYLTEFRLESGLPVWRYNVENVELERRVLMPHRQNTVFVNWRILAGGPVGVRLRPAVHFRSHDAPVSTPLDESYVFTASQDRYEVKGPAEFPALRMYLYGEEAAFTIYARKITEVVYRIEESRGYESRGQLWSPGHFWADLSEGHDATFVASTEPWDAVLALEATKAFIAERERRNRLVAQTPACVKQGMGAELVLAADQFIITPTGRVEDEARAKASGGEVRTVIAGYHWFTDWGRDTMISLEGLTLTTRRFAEAAWILKTFAYYVRDGLIPNMFPEGQREGLYHTADATLWFFHALDRFVKLTADREMLRELLPTMRDIVGHHLRGTRFGIGVHQDDGLLTQGAPGYQLTWMDAKVDDWVVTPRRGKAVEINALWYNALRLLECWLREERKDSESREIARHADRVRDSFNRRFWYEHGGYLYDVVDGESGDDAACRPNQVFAIALPHAVLDESRWEAVLSVVRERLLTPVGLRSLAPGHPDYKRQYFGDLRTRDAAYHQGTVWAWLIGPFVDAWLRVHPEDKKGARELLGGFHKELSDACVGSISEIFDAEAPYTPRGCCAQAWSVAEVLRCWAKTAE